MTCYRHPDRETGVSCSDCGRGICTECMRFAPVGIRCPDHSGEAQGAAKVTRTVRRAGLEGTGAIVTKALIALNVLVFGVNLAQGASVTGNGGSLYVDGFLIGRAFTGESFIGVAEGEWWRLLSSAFLHGGVIHLGLNMLVLWMIGSAMEEALGRARFLGIYLVSGLAGAAGALLLSEPNEPTVGASGAIFGLLGAALVLERQRNSVLAGSVLPIILLNLVFTFAIPNISIGGHLGGLAGGALCALALSRFGRGHAAYGNPGVAGIGGLVAIAALAVAVSYLKVRGYT